MRAKEKIIFCLVHDFSVHHCSGRSISYYSLKYKGACIVINMECMNALNGIKVYPSFAMQKEPSLVALESRKLLKLINNFVLSASAQCQTYSGRNQIEIFYTDVPSALLQM